jgi:hypothetical protein
MVIPAIPVTIDITIPNLPITSTTVASLVVLRISPLAILWIISLLLVVVSVL